MAVTIVFDWNPDDLKRFLSLTDEAFQRAFQLLAEDVWGNIRKESPTDHGRMGGSWDLSQITDFEYKIIAGVNYALFVHEGTGIYGPHQTPIVPTTADALAFDWQGKSWVLKSVKGQKPNKFVDRAIEKSKASIDNFINIALEEMGVSNA